MKLRTLLRSIFLATLFVITSVQAQSNADALYNSALKSYVDDLVIRYGKSTMDRERFLIQQLRMINEEMKTRISGVSEIRKSYFERLGTLLDEVRNLQRRLSANGSIPLANFAGEVASKIQTNIDNGTINYKKQKAIEDAVQLLHIGEEMVQLDPNAHLDNNPDFSQKYSRTKNKLQNTFGGENVKHSTANVQDQHKPTVFDVYKEWKKSELIKYQVRWTDVQIIKRKMYKNGNMSDRERMLKRELLQAAEAFNFANYTLSERSFDEILKSYKEIGSMDDVLFHKGQSNYLLGRYHQAEKDFNEFIIEYPSSSYLSDAYFNLMHIAFHFERYNRVLTYYRGMRSLLSANDPKMYKMTFMAAVAALKDDQFGRCVELAFEIPSTASVYRECRFVLAEAYAGMDNYEESKNTFSALIEDRTVPPEFRFTVLLKLGYLSYENLNFYDAFRYFDQIAGTFSEYDRVLIGYAWTSYRIELAKTDEPQRDFSPTEKYLQILLDNFYGSDYQLEARTLLAYVQQLQEKVDPALDNFEYVFNAREVKLFSDSLNLEQDHLRSAMLDAKQLQNKALQQNNPVAFSRAYSTVKNLRGPLNRLKYMDMSASGVALKSEVSRLNRQLAELDALKAKAQERGNSKLVQRIDQMQLKIYRAVNSVSISGESALGLNYFDGHPLARKESVVENNNRKISEMRENTQQQREEVAAQMAALDFDIQSARSAKDYRKMVHLELSKERLTDFAKKLDYLATRTYSSEQLSTDIDLEHWSNYGAFGMTNVRFAIRLNKAEEIAAFQNQIIQINEFLELRKSNIEHKIEKIADEIVLMTRRVRKQERIREREELKRQFEESYFDTHDTELDYEQGTTQPPKLEDDES